MAGAVTQTFIPGPRLIDGNDLNRAFSQVNAALPPQNVANAAMSDAAGATISAANMVGGLVTRSGTSAAFTDTTATAAAIVAAVPNNTAVAGLSWFLTIVNTTQFVQTLAAGAGVTLSGFTQIPANSTMLALVRLTSLTAVTMQGVLVNSNISMPPSQFTTAALSAGTIPAASIVGSQMCIWQNTGATPGNQTFPSAATLFAAIPGAYTGLSVMFRIVNTGAGTLTLVADGGATITISGTATVATNVTRDYMLTFTSPTAATVRSVGSGVSP